MTTSGIPNGCSVYSRSRFLLRSREKLRFFDLGRRIFGSGFWIGSLVKEDEVRPRVCGGD